MSKDRIITIDEDTSNWMREKSLNLKDFLTDNIRDLIDFNTDKDKPKKGYGENNRYYVDYDNKHYRFWLEGECLESDGDSSVFDWEIKDLEEI